MRRESLVLGPAGLARLDESRATPIPWPPDDDEDERVRQLFGAAEAGSVMPRSVTLFLEEPRAQFRTLRDLPGVGEKDLELLIDQEQSRFFRSAAGPLLTGASWARPSDGARLARAAATDREPIELLEDALAANGCTLVSVWARSADGARLELVTPRMRMHRRLQVRRRRAGLLGLALTGWVAAGAIYLLDLVGDRRTLQNELDALAGPLRRLEALEARMADFSPFAVAFHTQAAGRVTPWLARIVAALPDSVHLHELSVTESGDARLVVHAPDPVTLVRSFGERWPGGARLEGPDGSAEDGPVTLVLKGGS